MTKRTVFFFVLAFALVALATSAWVLRNHIIERLSGPILAQFGLEIVDVSLDAFATRDAKIGYLELRHTSGTTIEIDDLLLAVRESTDGRRRYQARRVFVTPGTDANDTTANRAQLIRQLLAVPESIPAIDVLIDELSVAALPTMSDVSLSVHADRQVLSLESAGRHIRLMSERVADSRHQVRLRLTTANGVEQSIDAGFLDKGDRILVDIDANADLDVWYEWLEQSPLSLPPVEFKPGSAALNLEVDIPDDASTDVTNWNLALESAALRATSDVWSTLDITAKKITCQNGIKCSMQATALADDVAMAAGRASSVEAAAFVEVRFGPEGLTVRLQPGVTISASQLSLADINIEYVDATIASETVIDINETGWRIAFDSLTAQIKQLAVTDFATSGSLIVEKAIVLLGDDNLHVNAGLHLPELPITVGSFAATLPDIRGTLTIEQRQLSAALTTLGLEQDGTLDLSVDTMSGSGSATLDRIRHSFATRSLTRIVTSPLPDFDLTAGSASLDGSLTFRNWLPRKGTLSTKLSGVAGFSSSIAFTGVATDLDFDYDAAGGLQAQPADISIGLVDIGFGLRELTARYHLRLQDESVDISDLKLDAFGGVVRVEPFSLDSNAVSHNVIVTLESIDLAKLLAAQDFGAIDLTGKVNGTIPVSIGGNGIRIEGGRIEGVAPGGIIRYQQSGAESGSPATGMGIATKALSNFEYETLSSDVSYQENGDLVLQMQIRGRNPDLEGGRPIVLNLGVENNVPQMLKSLQAARSIEDILERRVNK